MLANNESMGISLVLNQNQTGALYEDDAKIVLKHAGIPVVPEIRIPVSETTIQDAMDGAVKLGFPQKAVVVKAMGKTLTHKSDRGLVHTHLSNEGLLKVACQNTIESAGEDLEALLIQPMVQGKRELVAGMFRDPQFGPVIMFGLGGVYTEALQDVVFRLAPLTPWDMDEMISSFSAKSLLGHFRGEHQVNKSQLYRILSALSDLALTYPQIQEIDINPLIITPEGELTAVDALIITGKRENKVNHRPLVDKIQLASLFHPKTVAFVGASSTIGKWGHMLPSNTLSGSFKGKAFLVNPKGGTILGQTVYKSLDEIPVNIDLVVMTLPAHLVLEQIPQLQNKGAKGMLLITSGFSEVGPEGKVLEEKVVSAAADAGIVVLGPNTMGICNPHIGFDCNASHAHPIPGSTALVCQSGNLGTQLLAFATQQDLGIRGFAGSGNEAMTTIEDYLEMFEVDDKTGVVVLYIESVKEGRRFFESATRLSKKKPVIVLSGGRTEIGTKAASSHTGAMASNAKVTASMLRQAGVIEVSQPMDLLDLSAVFSSLPLPKGSRVAIMTLGGGWGVVTADLCEENGLVLPELSTEVIAHLNTLLPDYWSHGNPVDIVGERDPKIPKETLEALLKWEGCDAVIHLGIHGRRLLVEKMGEAMAKVDPNHTEEHTRFMKEYLANEETAYVEHVIRLTEQYEKPVLGVSLTTDPSSRSIYRVDGCRYDGIFFPSPERAVKALAGMCRYSRWLNRH